MILLTKLLGIIYSKPMETMLSIAFILFIIAILIFVSSLFTGVIYDTTIAILVVSSLQIALFGILADILLNSKEREE